MNELPVLFALFLLGIVAQFAGFLPKDLFRKINRFIIYVPLPAIVLAKIPHLQLSAEVMYPIASAWIIFFGAAIYGWLVGKWLNWDNKTIACIILCCGLGNTSFVGYPVLTYFYGAESIQYAIFVDQPGSFLIMSTLGILIAASFGGTDYSVKQLLLRLVKFPPFLIFIVALFIPKEMVEGNALKGLNMIGQFMVPLAMISLGMQFKWNISEVPWRDFLAGSLYKLILAPFIIYILFYLILDRRTELYTVSIIECAMPPMITSSILATEYGLNEKLANALPTLGILLSVPSLLFWRWWLSA